MYIIESYDRYSSLLSKNHSIHCYSPISTHFLTLPFHTQAKKAARISVIGCEEELQDLKRQLEEESAHTKQVRGGNTCILSKI